jgi:hypothetical protein
MSLDVVRLGEIFTAQTSFTNNDGTPFVPTSPATYVIYDFNNNFVISGIAEQNGTFPEQWSASITLPASSIFSPNQKYYIKWSITGATSTIVSNEYFNVESEEYIGDDQQWQEVDHAVLEYGTVNDSLHVPNFKTVTSYTVRIIDDCNNVIFPLLSVTNPTPTLVSGEYIYSFSSGNLPLLEASYKPYLIEWTYVVDGVTQTKYHFVYVVNYSILILMQRLREFIDKAKFNHPNPSLRYNDVDLISYLLQGVQIFNATKPYFTNFYLSHFPRQFEWFLINCAAYVALSAQYLAETESSFELSGQSVSLTVDRSAGIESALSRIISILETQLPTAKRLAGLSAVTGVLGISVSPTNNPRFYSGLEFDLGFPGDFLQARGEYYNSFIETSVVMSG